MSTFRAAVAISLLGATLAVTGCDSADKKRAKVTPPPNAAPPALTHAVEKPDAAPVPAKAPEPPKPDAVDALIARAQEQYKKGVANYNAGHLETAKDDFDRAFNILTSGPVDIRSDERLEREFDKLVEGVNSLELVALKQGDGFTEQRSDPAPIDEANEVTFPVDPNVKAQAEAEVKQTRSDLPLVMNDHVASFITYFSNRGRTTIERGLVRSGRYREMILRVLKEEGVPQDLLYLAQAESGFLPLAVSRAGARGMWQFMASRASGYGLQRNWWLDERQDPEKATRAAARHLKDLYSQFGDWYLAMAAYNSGPGNVQRAVQRTGYADFWELYRRNVLPKETRNYVPIIVAVTIMAKNAERYGLDDLRLDEPPQVDQVTIKYPVDLRLVAECAETTVANLQDLNPSLLRMTTPKDQEFTLNLPAGTGKRFEQIIATIPTDKRVWWRYHKVQNGESLETIARRYRTTPASIAEVNSLEDSSELLADARLVIPVTPGRSIEEGAMQYSKRPTYYKVRKGDSVASVADDFGVTVSALRKWNRLRGNALRRGRTLKIYRPVVADDPVVLASAKKPKATKVSATKLQPVNIVEADDEDDEELVTDPSPSTKPVASRKPAPEHAAASKARIYHKVKQGDTLYSIAIEYNTTVANLRRDNRKYAKVIKPGDVILVRR